MSRNNFINFLQFAFCLSMSPYIDLMFPMLQRMVLQLDGPPSGCPTLTLAILPTPWPLPLRSVSHAEPKIKPVADTRVDKGSRQYPPPHPLQFGESDTSKVLSAGQLSPFFSLWQMKTERSNPSSKWERKTQAGSNLVVQVNIWIPSQCLSEISLLCLRSVSISQLIALIYSPLSWVPCCLLSFLPPWPCFFYSMLFPAASLATVYNSAHSVTFIFRPGVFSHWL